MRDIRRLHHTDLDSYRTLRLLALRETPMAFGSSYEEEASFDDAQFAARLADDGLVQMFGAFIDGELLGMAGIGREPALKEQHRAFIRSMYVHPRARRLGLARLLLSHVLAIADQMPGVRQVTLTATAGHEPALRLYESHGFVVYGRAPESLFVDGTYHDDLLMVRHRPTG